MNLRVSLFGYEVLAISTDPAEEWDQASDLSGGELGSMVLDVGPTDRYMGFTLGLEADDE